MGPASTAAAAEYGVMLTRGMRSQLRPHCPSPPRAHHRAFSTRERPHARHRHSRRQHHRRHRQAGVQRRHRDRGGKIAAVGGKQGPARREIDADGLLVTPGWVDVHTHYDGQAMWDPLLAPSCWHGVTTVMFGNCGVGFAPVKKEHRGALMDLMEGVEEIPNPVLAAGLNWEWETFPQYMDELDRRAARDRHRRADRAPAAARLRDGRPRDPARGGHSGRHRRDAPPHRRGAALRRVRLHHLAHRLAQDAGRRRSCPRATPTITSCSASAPRWASPAAARSA